MKYRLKATAAAVLICFSTSHARATGFPVIDVANLFQSVQQVVNDITQIYNQLRQIEQLQTQIESINGIRNLGDVFNNPLLKNYIPAEAYTYLNAIQHLGVQRPQRHGQGAARCRDALQLHGPQR